MAQNARSHQRTSNLNYEEATIQKSEFDGCGALVGLYDGLSYKIALNLGNGKIIIIYEHEKGSHDTNLMNLINFLRPNKRNFDFIGIPNIQNESEFKLSNKSIYKVNLFKTSEMSAAEYLVMLSKNFKAMATFEEGDIIAFDRALYSHMGIFKNFKMYKVIHLNSEINQVIEENLIDVMGTCDIKRHNYLDSEYKPRPKDEIIKYAEKRTGNAEYSAIFNNSQHFATKCRNDHEESTATKTAITLGSIAGAVGFAGALFAAFMFSKPSDSKNGDKK